MRNSIFSKNVEKLLENFKERIQLRNLGDLIEEYNRLARIIFVDYKPEKEKWVFARIRPDPNEKTKAILVKRAIEDEMNHEINSQLSQVCRRYFATISLTPVDVISSQRSQDYFKSGFERYIAETLKSEVQSNANKLGGWKHQKFRRHLADKLGILTEVGDNGLFFGNHWKGPVFFDVEGFVELPEELAETKSQGILSRLFK